MKICPKCKIQKDETEFYISNKAKDGLTSYCKPCSRVVNYNHRAKHREYYRRMNRDHYKKYKARLDAEGKTRTRFPEKQKARNILNKAILHGNIIPKPCEVCGAIDVQAHHEDYSKPLEVEWLCFIHHSARHRDVKNA